MRTFVNAEDPTGLWLTISQVRPIWKTPPVVLIWLGNVSRPLVKERRTECCSHGQLGAGSQGSRCDHRL